MEEIINTTNALKSVGFVWIDLPSFSSLFVISREGGTKGSKRERKLVVWLSVPLARIIS